MKKILANDGISPSGKQKLEENGFDVITDTVDQVSLINAINQEGYVGLIVRSATKVRADLMDACPGLKIVGRGGVGMDNIDVQYGRDKGLHVVNTPGASAQSVAELAMGTLFSMARFTYDAGRKMPVEGQDQFKSLKKTYGKGTELRGKTIGIVGFGGIGQDLAKYALGCGMYVLYTALEEDDTTTLTLDIAAQQVDVVLRKRSMEEVLSSSDYISLHVPAQPDGSAVIGEKEFNTMKDGVCIVNTSRGGIVDDHALITALDNGKVKAAALDVFVNEPAPRQEVLVHPRIISTPHIGGSTMEAQDRIGLELADQFIELLN